MSGPQRRIILAGVDGSTHSADALALANTLAPAFQADAVAACVDPSGSSEDSVQAHMRDLAIPVDARRLRLIADRSAARGLQRVAERQAAVLIALGASRRSRLGRVLLGTTAERLMSASPCPVAIAPSGYADESRSIGTIGCAFDGSPESRAALTWAAAMAKSGGSRLRLLTVHEPLVSAVPAFQGVPIVVEDEAIRDYLGRQLEAAALDLRRAGITVDPSLLTGRAVALLEEQSSQLDLLVMGSRGSSGTRAVLLGSVSGALARHAACPVVVIPRDARGEDRLRSEVSADVVRSSELVVGSRGRSPVKPAILGSVSGAGATGAG